MARFLTAGATLALLALASGAEGADLRTVARTLAKQPAYAGKPAYVLAVFGASMERKVWLAMDGTTLYVDKNGNGDLTEPAERVAAVSAPSVEDSEHQRATTTEWEIGTLPAVAGSRAYEGVFVSHDLIQVKPGAPATVRARNRLSVYVTLKDGCEQSAAPTPGARPEDAPVLHLDGPLAIMQAGGPLGSVQSLPRGAEPQEITVQIGTPGMGEGSWASVGYDLVPDTIHPVLEISFPPATPGGAPVVGKFTLDQRC